MLSCAKCEYWELNPIEGKWFLKIVFKPWGFLTILVFLLFYSSSIGEQIFLKKKPINLPTNLLRVHLNTNRYLWVPTKQISPHRVEDTLCAHIRSSGTNIHISSIVNWFRPNELILIWLHRSTSISEWWLVTPILGRCEYLFAYVACMVNI